MYSAKRLRVSSVIQLGGLLLLIQAAAGIAQAAEPAAPNPLSAEEKIHKALASPTQTDFVKLPLSDAVDYLASKHNIEIQLDTKALEELGVAADTPITRSVKGVSLRSALRLILEPLQLTYTIKNEVLLITSADKAKEALTTKVYPVGDLVIPSRRIGGRDGADFESLIQLITSTLQPSTWDAVGGPGSIACYDPRLCLVVSQTAEEHEEIANLLQHLRTLRRAWLASANAAGGKPKEAVPESIRLKTCGPADERIRKALASPTEMDFHKTPLTTALEYLKKYHKIEIQLDQKALEELGVAADSPVTRKLKGTSLRSALHLILDPLQLTYLIKHEVMLITSNERMSREEEIVLYPVADLVLPAGVPVEAMEQGGTADFDSLIELITSTVGPSTWNAVGGPGQIASFPSCMCLVFAQTADVHEEVAELLQKLRSIPRTTERVAVDLRLALQDKADADFDKMPLAKLLDHFKDRYQVKIELDEKAISAAGVRLDAPVSGRVAGVRWRLALRQLLGELKLGYIVENHVLLITSQERAAKELLTNVYSAWDLPVAGGGGMGAQRTDLKSILDAITTTVRPNSWTSKGGPGTAVAVNGLGCLVIKQTQEIHEEIDGLLQKLQEASWPWGEFARPSPPASHGHKSEPQPQSGMSGGGGLGGGMGMF